MWNNILFNFLYVLGATNTVVETNTVGSIYDWVDLSSNVVIRCLATKNSSNDLGNIALDVVTLPTVNSSLTYTEAVDGVTNIIPYVLGNQATNTIIRPNEPYGFDIADYPNHYYNLRDYGVSPLLWVDVPYDTNTAINPLSSLSGVYKPVGKYPEMITTQAWSFYGASNIVIAPQRNESGTITNIPPFYYSTSVASRAYYDLSLLNQRPNAITPSMTLKHWTAITNKINQLCGAYADDTYADEQDDYNDYFASNSNVTQQIISHWLGEADEPTQTNTFVSYRYDVYGVPTNTVTTLQGSETNYNRIEYLTNYYVVEVGAGDDWDYYWDSSSGYWTNVLVTNIVVDGSGAFVSNSYVTNIIQLTTGVTVASGQLYDKIISTNILMSHVIETNKGQVLAGHIGDAEFDFWTYKDVPGTSDNYTYATIISSNQVEYETSEATEEPVVASTNYYIWARVSDQLADYLKPIIEDGKSTANNKYIFSYGWDAALSNNNWRLWQYEAEQVGVETNYWEFEKDYFLTVEDEAKHYEKLYKYYWLNDRETNIVTNAWHEQEDYKSEWIDTPGVRRYYKNMPEISGTNYWLDMPDYVMTVPTKCRVTVTNYPIDKLPKYGTPENLLARHNLSTNIYINDAYQTMTQQLVSAEVKTVTNMVDGVEQVFSWTNYVYTNTIVSVDAEVENPLYFVAWRTNYDKAIQILEKLRHVEARGGFVEFEMQYRYLRTTNHNDVSGWTGQSISTGTYYSYRYSAGVSGGAYPDNYTHDLTTVRAVRCADCPVDGAIDVYGKFGDFDGYYDFLGSDYPIGCYVKIDELCIPKGETHSEWLGDINSLPIVGRDHFLKRPQGLSLRQYVYTDLIIVFRPEF